MSLLLCLLQVLMFMCLQLFFGMCFLTIFTAGGQKNERNLLYDNSSKDTGFKNNA